MKDSEVYKILQILVVSSDNIDIDRKIEIMRFLFSQEDIALYAEGSDWQKEFKDGTI